MSRLRGSDSLPEAAASARRHRVNLILNCGVIELMSWGALYYTVPVLHVQISADTGWSVQYLTLTYSFSLVVAALVGPQVGRLIDSRGPRQPVVGGVLLGTIGLLIVASATTVVGHAAGMLVLGVAQALTLYPPIFAALTIWFGSDKARALTVVSLFGGASSTVFAPSLAPLVNELQWRGALATVALLYLLVTTAAAWFGLRMAWPSHASGDISTRQVNVLGVSRTWRFRALQLSMVLSGVGLYASTLNVIGLAREAGYSYEFATSVFGLVGAGQVVGRLLYLPLSRRGSPQSRTMLQVLATGLTVAGLGLAVSNPTLLIAAAVGAGAVRGAHTLVMVSGVSERWGLAQFGALSGTFNRPVALAIAVSPFIGSSLAAATGSYRSAALVLAGCAATGLLFARRT